ncbi:hypothetical protein F383_36470 [Gossypium arboreum]|uniref:Uncharacterized protein n=1 Tax=Gossypium arboreum TaxID=29729 RepID=A0A0B0N3P7_GOSAR|nr:hypothetical protein F383_36470 [Gossypium arboreum]
MIPIGSMVTVELSDLGTYEIHTSIEKGSI